MFHICNTLENLNISEKIFIIFSNFPINWCHEHASKMIVHVRTRNLKIFFSFPGLRTVSTFQSSLIVNQLHFTRSSTVDINEVMLIKVIVMFYCLSACSMHRYGEAVVHAHCKLKPRLLLTSHCHFGYFNLALSLTELLATVASAVHRPWLK